MILTGGNYGGQNVEDLGAILIDGVFDIDGWNYNEEGIFIGMK